MITTGWISEPPEAEAPALPLTQMLLRNKERGPGDTLALALRSRDEPDETPDPDPDEHAAHLVARGYLPGMLSQLAQRLADTLASLDAEQAKLEASRRRQEHFAREHAAGRITALDIARSLQDADEGDPAAVTRLERRADSLRKQIAGASQLSAPQERRAPDPFEAASQRAARAHREFAEATRKMAGPDPRQARSPRPFGSASRGASAVRAEPTCPECLAAGATADESFLIHQDPAPVPVPPDATHCRGCGALWDWCSCTHAAGQPG